MTSEQKKRERENRTRGLWGRSRGGVEDGKTRVMGNINKASKNSSRREKVRIGLMGLSWKVRRDNPRHVRRSLTLKY